MTVKREDCTCEEFVKIKFKLKIVTDPKLRFRSL